MDMRKRSLIVDGSYGSRLEKGKRNCGIINAVFVSQAN